MRKISGSVAYIKKISNLSVDEQKKLIEKFASENNLEITSWIEDVKSVSDNKNEYLNNLIVFDNIKNPPFENFVVAKDTILSTDILEYFYFFLLFKKKNIKLVCVENNFNVDESYIKLRDMIEFIANKDKANLANKTSIARNKKASNGFYAGGRCPLGYDVKNGVLVVNKKEAEVVVKIFELYDKRMSMNQIAKYLEENGYVGKTGIPMSFTAVWYIVQRRKFYQGYMDYGNKDEWIKGVHEPILKE